MVIEIDNTTEFNDLADTLDVAPKAACRADGLAAAPSAPEPLLAGQLTQPRYEP
jgi:hypothetical protein